MVRVPDLNNSCLVWMLIRWSQTISTSNEVTLQESNYINILIPAKQWCPWLLCRDSTWMQSGTYNGKFVLSSICYMKYIWVLTGRLDVQYWERERGIWDFFYLLLYFQNIPVLSITLNHRHERWQKRILIMLIKHSEYGTETWWFPRIQIHAKALCEAIP